VHNLYYHVFACSLCHTRMSPSSHMCTITPAHVHNHTCVPIIIIRASTSSHMCTITPAHVHDHTWLPIIVIIRASPHHHHHHTCARSHQHICTILHGYPSSLSTYVQAHIIIITHVHDYSSTCAQSCMVTHHRHHTCKPTSSSTHVHDYTSTCAQSCMIPHHHHYTCKPTSSSSHMCTITPAHVHNHTCVPIIIITRASPHHHHHTCA
jgi:hypothetical protein